MIINPKIKIEDLNMSNRTTRALINNKIFYVKDLIDITQDDMLKWRNFSIMSRRELTSKLRELGINISLI